MSFFKSAATLVQHLELSKRENICPGTGLMYVNQQGKTQRCADLLKMLFIFQIGVTMIYIVWRRDIPLSKAVDRAIRDCTAILSIFADRSQNADVYRDCIDLLASSVSRTTQPVSIDAESRRELAVLVGQVEENRLASHIHSQLLDMCKDNTIDGQ